MLFMRIEFKDLPKSVQERIQFIQSHREEWAFNAKFASGILIGIAGAGKVVHATEPNAFEGLFIASLFGAGELGMGIKTVNKIREHFPRYKAEYVALFDSIKEARADPKLRELISSFPYLVVDKRGNLVGKKRMNVIMKWPIGRRRVASPALSDAKIAGWRKSFPQRREAGSKNALKRVFSLLRTGRKN